jgi:hypothetical protein
LEDDDFNTFIKAVEIKRTPNDLINNSGWDTGLLFSNNIVICFKVNRYGWKFILGHGVGSAYAGTSNYSILLTDDISSLNGEYIIRIYYINKNL